MISGRGSSANSIPALRPFAEGIFRDRHALPATVSVNGVQRPITVPPGTQLTTIRPQHADG